MVDGAALEKRSPLKVERGFESHPLRQIELLLFYGEVLEWSNRRAWRARVAFGYRGFESHPLRQLFSIGILSILDFHPITLLLNTVRVHVSTSHSPFTRNSSPCESSIIVLTAELLNCIN